MMQFLIKEKWSKFDQEEIENYLISIKNSEDAMIRERKIVNTSFSCFGISSKLLDEIVKHICLGNYFSFLNEIKITNYPLSIIHGKIINKIEDFDIFKLYLDKYSLLIDSWAHCDLFKLKVNKLGKTNLKKLIEDYSNSPIILRRRIAIIFLLKHFINEHDIDFTFKIILKFYNEKEYYVNMAISWLICEIAIKEKEPLFNFLKMNKLNEFVQKKSISKCKDSLRVDLKTVNHLIGLMC